MMIGSAQFSAISCAELVIIFVVLKYLSFMYVAIKFMFF